MTNSSATADIDAGCVHLPRNLDESAREFCDPFPEVMQVGF